MQLRCGLLLALVAGAVHASEVTPIEKVIELIEGLKDEVEADGKAEADTYNEFACFCKDTTMEKSKSVNEGHDKIDELSTDIADKTQERANDKTELAERAVEQQKMSKELAETESRYAKEKAEYEVEEADLAKAIQSLKDAIKAMKDSKPSAASFVAIRKSLGKTLEMAEAMSLLASSKHKKAVAAFLQQSVDPADPEYKFHSDDIIEVCENLLVEYKANKKELDEEWAKAEKAFKEKIAALKKKMSANEAAMKKLKKNIEKLSEEIAQHREDLVIAKGQMEDDELYLKDLTKRCEERSHDWDQRSAMRADELNALESALKVLKNSVEERANEVNVRAMLMQKAAKASTPVAPVAVKKESPKTVQKPISFLQGASVSAESREATKESAIDVLRQEGRRLGSLTLLSLAERVSADPFTKVKKLIQALIERLLTEAKNEATKKGFCDTELGKAEKDRDYRYEEATDLSADLASLEAKRDELQAEIKKLQKEIKEETKALKETTKDRKKEKEDNMKTLKTAKEGEEALKEALTILRSFYKEAAKASGPGGYVAFLDASPVDEDTQGAGFKGNYAGKQGGMKAVFALLETLASDFDRTLRKTEEAEHQAHRDFVDYEQTAKASIAGKTTKKELDEADLKTTLTDIDTKMDDMQTAVDLLDAALQTLEELKPTCIDTGMSYAERVEKREEEIAALKKALEILAPPGL